MILNIVQKAAIQGVITSGVSLAQFGTGKGVRVQIPMLGIQTGVPLYAITGGLGAAASVVADIAHIAIHPGSDSRKKVRDQGEMVIGLLTAAGAFTFGMGCVHPAMIQDYGLLTTLAVGVGSEIAAGLVADNLEGMRLI